MKYQLTFMAVMLLTLTAAAQEKKDLREKIEDIALMLIAQPEPEADTNANRLMDDNLSMIVPQVWRQKGILSLTEFKLPKADEEPIVSTLPLPKKRLVQAITITMKTLKKSPAYKKLLVLTQVKNHLAALYKEAGQPLSAEDLNAKAETLQISAQPFTTREGLAGELLLMHDLEYGKSNLLLLFVAHGKTEGTCIFVQYNFYHANFETELPENITDWRLFLYPDEQEEFVNYAMAMLSTFRVR